MSDASPPVASAPPPPAEARPPSSRKKLILAAAGAVGAIVLLTGGWLAYRMLTHKPEPARIEAKTPAPSKTPAAPKTEKSSAPAPESPSLPATAQKTAAPAPPSATLPPTPAPEPVAAAELNPAAQEWINKLRISGVRGGASPKILLQGKTFSVGDVIHPDFGLTFISYDAARDTVRFKDSNGAIYERGVR